MLFNSCVKNLYPINTTMRQLNASNMKRGKNIRNNAFRKRGSRFLFWARFNSFFHSLMVVYLKIKWVWIYHPITKWKQRCRREIVEFKLPLSYCSNSSPSICELSFFRHFRRSSRFNPSFAPFQNIGIIQMKSNCENGLTSFRGFSRCGFWLKSILLSHFNTVFYLFIWIEIDWNYCSVLSSNVP